MPPPVPVKNLGADTPVHTVLAFRPLAAVHPLSAAKLQLEENRTGISTTSSCVDGHAAKYDEQWATVQDGYSGCRECYKQGLAHNPGLAGKTAYRIVVGRDGTMTDVQAQANTLPDCDVVECVRRRIEQLSFPEGAAASVNVVSPTFAPARWCGECASMPC
jgi:hypothetical protein